MRSYTQHFIIWNVIALLAFFFIITITETCRSENQQDISNVPSPFKICALIMEIDLEKNYIIVAEEKIHLLATTQSGLKQWLTVFTDTNDQKISTDDLRPRAKIIVEGEKMASGKMEAQKIILQTVKRESFVTESNKSSPVPSIHLNNGVWKN